MRFARSNVLDQINLSPQLGLAGALVAWFQMPWTKKFPRLCRGQADRRMEIVEVLQLGGKRQLMLIACDGRHYMVGAGADSVHSVTELAGGNSAKPPSDLAVECGP